MGDWFAILAAYVVISCGLLFSLYHNLKDGYKIPGSKPRKKK